MVARGHDNSDVCGEPTPTGGLRTALGSLDIQGELGPEKGVLGVLLILHLEACVTQEHPIL